MSVNGAEEYTRAAAADSVPDGPRRYQHIFAKRMLPFQFDDLDPTADEYGRDQFEVETVYLIPVLSSPAERLRLNLEEAYALNGETRRIERAVIHGDGGVEPVLVLRDGQLFLEDANKQKSPLEVRPGSPPRATPEDACASS